MQIALNEAKTAFSLSEIPIGAVIVWHDKIIAKAHNQTELLNDATAHAEMIAMTSAMETLGSKYLHDCTMYVTTEPCVMCAGAIQWAQIPTIVFGVTDIKKGFSHFTKNIFSKKIILLQGVMEEECRQILKEFFLKRRQ